jgi:hypothetical protein
LTVAADASGYNSITTNVKTAMLPSTTYAAKWVIFTDSVIKAPATVAPAADSVQNNTTGANTMVDFNWSSAIHATKYDVQIAYDSAFTNIVSTTTVLTGLSGTTITGVSLPAGKTYYWRVRVAMGSPLASVWAAPVKFSTIATGSSSTGIDTAGRIYPDQGAVITGTALTFTWGSVSTADTYEFKLLKDGVEVVSKTGLTDTFFNATGLVAGAQYTWQVRAIAGGVAGKWVTSAFTTVVPPATTQAPTTAPPASQPPAVTPIVTVTVPAATIPQPTINVTVPPAESTGTPAWAWIVIAIGAVLVIAVIVLIVRTRKV